MTTISTLGGAGPLGTRDVVRLRLINMQGGGITYGARIIMRRPWHTVGGDIIVIKLPLSVTGEKEFN
jgi:hypothetical protein